LLELENLYAARFTTFVFNNIIDSLRSFFKMLLVIVPN